MRNCGGRLFTLRENPHDVAGITETTIAVAREMNNVLDEAAQETQEERQVRILREEGDQPS